LTDVVGKEITVAKKDPAEKRFEYWANQLLDQSRSNRMIHYRKSSRQTLDITEPASESLFEAMVSGKELSFKRPIARDTAPRAWALLSLMSALGKPVTVTVGDVGYRGEYRNVSETLTHMRRRNRLAHEEQGCHILHLVFGFVIWKDGKKGADGSPFVKSPLLLVPVDVNQKRPNDPFTVKKTDDDIVVNPALAFMMEKAGIILPEFNENHDTFEGYLEKIELLAEEHGWQITREASLGLVMFQKISMYKDLMAHKDALIKHPFVQALAEGRPLPPLEKRDPDAITTLETAQVMSADSSQMQAILAARAGQSFLMEGPPGTGKSQTITNIIADAMLRGKKVLFVSSKNAALRVVYRRLYEVGLAPFCLDIHSHKANKLSILKDIELAFSTRAAGLNDREKLALGELEELKQSLNGYHRALHTPLSFYPATPYLCLSNLSELSSLPEIPISSVPESEEELLSLIRLAARYDGVRREYLSTYGEIPTVLLGLTLSGPDDVAALSGALVILGKSLVALLRLSREHEISLDGLPFSALDTVADMLDAATALPKPLSEALSGEKAGDVMALCEGLVNAISEKEALEERIENAAYDSIYGFSAESWQIRKRSLMLLLKRDAVYKALLEKSGKKELGEGEVMSAISLAEGLLDALKLLNSASDSFSALTRTALQKNLATLRELAAFLPVIGERVLIAPSWYTRDTNADLRRVRAASTVAEVITAIETELVATWTGGVFELPYRRLREAYGTEVPARLSIFQKNGQRDTVRLLRTYTQNGGVPTHDEILSLFERLEAYDIARRQFAGYEAHLRELCTLQYRGAHTDFSLVEKSLEFLNGLRAIGTPPNAIKTYFSTPFSLRNTEKTQKALEGISHALQTLSALTSDMPLTDEHTDTVTMELSFVKSAQSLKALGELDREFASHLKYPLGEEDKKSLLSCLSRRMSLSAEVKSGEKALSELIGTESLTRGRLPEVLSLLFTLAPLVKEAPALYHQVLSLGVAKEGRALSKALKEEARATKDALSLLTRFFPTRNLEGEKIRLLKAFVTRLLESHGVIEHALPLLSAFNELAKHGLSAFVLEYEEKDPTDPAADVLRKSLYTAILRRAEDERPILKEMTRQKKLTDASRFSSLDKRSIAIARRRVKFTVTQRIPRGERNWRGEDELSIFEEEMKKRRHMPLRKLFSQIPQLLMTLKPCFMMSPLSVSYFLERDAYSFDLVIFDEASQLFPEDAIGAIRRSKQVIVVGDSHQLPPTDFFSVKNENDPDSEEDDDTPNEIGASILECAAEVMDRHMLRWHYRSRHESLIAFSNYHIYENRLITFPSPSDDELDTGVEYVYVKNGVYIPKLSENPEEAKACVRMLDKHIRSHPDRSLGIIAFGKKQQSAIEKAVTEYRLSYPEHEAFFSEGNTEPFFVKNLENVQGDERDTIIFSIGYGKTEKGRFSLNLGPLSKPGGERRLNVAITRAKHNIKLIGSVMPEDFDLSRTESAGVHLLYRYIDYALNPDEAFDKKDVEEEERDPFPISIARFLTENGYRARCRFGSSDCRVDLAVYHPEHKGAIAAIMTDGGSYAANPVARDREELRISTLRGMGWNVYYAWVTEWVKDREREEKSLLRFLADCVKKKNETDGTVVTEDIEEATDGCEHTEETVEIVTEFRENATNSCEIPYHFTYYREGDCFRASLRDKNDKNTVIADRMLYLVGVEAPIHKELLYKRLAPSFRAGKLTENVRRILDGVLDELLQSGSLTELEENFFVLSSEDPITVRIPAPDTQPRTFDHIATAELAEAMALLVKETFGVLPEELFLETVRVFGFERMSPRMRTSCDKALYHLLMSERVVRIDGKIRLSESH